jgi:hypothetical protein
VSIQIPRSQRAHAIRALFIGLCVITSARPPASGAESSIAPVLIFLQPADALEPVGILTFEANPLILRGPITPVRSDPAATQPAGSEQGRHTNAGIQFRPLLAVPQSDGGCLVLGSDSQESPEQPKSFLWRLYRARTPDGYHYTELTVTGISPWPTSTPRLR